MDRFETFVRWYLRFNGYFSIENYILHRPVGKSVLQDGEFDTLGVRFPHSREDLAEHGPIQNDDQLSLRADFRTPLQLYGKPLIDFVVAEVKSGQVKLNKAWLTEKPRYGDANPIRNLVLWMGPLREDKSLDKVASDLSRTGYARSGDFVFRLLLFCKRDRMNPQLAVPQISFESIARWIVTSRTPSWHDRGYGARSARDQWDPMIKEIWEVGNPKEDIPTDKRVSKIMDVLAAK